MKTRHKVRQCDECYKEYCVKCCSDAPRAEWYRSKECEDARLARETEEEEGRKYALHGMQ